MKVLRMSMNLLSVIGWEGLYLRAFYTVQRLGPTCGRSRDCLSRERSSAFEMVNWWIRVERVLSVMAFW